MKKLFSFRYLAAIVLAVAFALTFSAFSNDDNSNVVKRIQTAFMNLANTEHTLVDEFDYWPECGIRVTGSHLASLISLSEFEQMLPYPLYVSGPHHDGTWDLDNKDDFGHYNPEAIEYLVGVAQKMVADENFVAWSTPLVDKYLRRQMHIMMVIHDALYYSYSQEERETVFRTSVATQGLEYGAQEVGFFLDMLNLHDESYVYDNIDYSFLHFWARRWSDGTLDQFYQLLSTLFMAYYPDYNFDPEIYWLESEEPEYYEVDTYVVIDGSDLRLRLEPSTSADTFKWPDGTNRHPKVGERFYYLGEEGDFYQISFYGNALWVSKKYTHLEAE